MPCVQARQRAEREEHIRRNRVEVNPYVGITDPVELLKIMHQPRPDDPLVRVAECPKSREQLYLELDSEQARRLRDHAVALLAAGDEQQAEDIAVCLVAFTDRDLEPLLRELVARAVFHPGFLFRGATPTIRDELVARLEAAGRGLNRLVISHLLVALAWIGDDRVVALFARWRAAPPPWHEALHVPPERYAEEAGWTLRNSNTRRDLFFSTCYQLVVRAGVGQSPATAVTPREERCPWCARELVNLFDLTPRAPQLAFLGLPDDRLRVPTCEFCCGYAAVIFTRFRGQAVWHERNTRPAYLPDDRDTSARLPRDKLALAASPRRPLQAVDWGASLTACSQIGGFPTWIQGSFYPACPDCAEKMTFIGQLACEDIEEHGEGHYYVHICATCGVAATSYQQT